MRIRIEVELGNEAMQTPADLLSSPSYPFGIKIRRRTAAVGEVAA